MRKQLKTHKNIWTQRARFFRCRLWLDWWQKRLRGLCWFLNRLRLSVAILGRELIPEFSESVHSHSHLDLGHDSEVFGLGKSSLSSHVIHSGSKAWNSFIDPVASGELVGMVHIAIVSKKVTWWSWQFIGTDGVKGVQGGIIKVKSCIFKVNHAWKLLKSRIEIVHSSDFLVGSSANIDSNSKGWQKDNWKFHGSKLWWWLVWFFNSNLVIWWFFNLWDPLYIYIFRSLAPSLRREGHITEALQGGLYYKTEVKWRRFITCMICMKTLL